MKIHVALDSGAHSLFSKYAAPGMDWERMDFSFYDSAKFDQYLDKFVAFVKQHQQHFEFYVTIDVIFNPEKTWEIFKRLEAVGLKPLPILHYGEDLKWLKKFCDRYEYIGLGGLGQMVTRNSYLKFGDEVFGYLTDDKGRCTHKVHGFAMTAYGLLMRYPWHSVDSTTPFSFSRYGGIQVPRTRNGRFDFLSIPFMTPVSERRGKAPRHYLHLPSVVQSQVLRWLDHCGVTLQEVMTTYDARDIVNLIYMDGMMKAIRQSKDDDFRYYVSGKPSGSDDMLPTLLDSIAAKGVEDFYYLGTYFLPKPTMNVLKYKESRNANQTASRRPQVGRPVIARDGLHSHSRPLLLRK